MVKKSLPKYLEMFIESLRILETNKKKGLKLGISILWEVFSVV